MPKPALIIEDDPDIAESVRYNLETAGFSALVASTGEQGFTLAMDTQNPPAVIVLDLMLPGMNGMELCRRLRREQSNSANPDNHVDSEDCRSDRVAGLDVGADDYIGKPFSVRELLARVRAVLRRAEDEVGERYDDGRLTIDFDDVRALCDGVNVKLTNKEFLLLSTLARKKDKVITRQQLLDHVWGYSYYGDARTLDVHIRRLRQKLDACGNCIETVVGVGYRFVGCEAASSGSTVRDG
jgi:DNA-binding response OmpR family regulator